MSGLFKAIGKIFKTVVKVVAAVAAVAAVVFTGGAALGIALPSLGSVVGSLGLGAALTPILTSAASSAALGAGLAAVTGGDPLKGATAGFVTGGLLGATGSAIGKAGSVATKTSTGGLGTAAPMAMAPAATGTSVSALTAPMVTQAAQLPISTASQAIIGASTPSLVTGGLGTVAGAGGTAAAVPASGGGFLGLGGMSDTIKGNLISGIGQGIAANESQKALLAQEQRIRDNYAGTTGFVQPGSGTSVNPNLPDAGSYYNQQIYGKKLTYNPAVGQIQAA